LLEINAIKRQRLIETWKATIWPYKKADGSHEVSPEVRALLQEMKPHVKQIVEEAVDVTPTQRKEPINERLARQAQNLRHLHKLRSLVDEVRVLLGPEKTVPSGILQDNLTRIRNAFKEGIASGKEVEHIAQPSPT
jgi:hypothetical protein